MEEQTKKGTTSFPKIYRVDAPEVDGILTSPVEITEKMDGSQFGFGIIDGELVMRSKSAILNPANPQNLFAGAVQTVLSVKDKLVPGWFYYGESIQSKRHNKLCYDVVPKGHVCLFGVKKPDFTFIDDWRTLQEIATDLGMDVAPLIYSGILNMDELLKLVDETKSAYGAPYMEGVVVKNYALRGNHSPIMVGKLVKDEFKEVKRERKPKGTGDTIETKILSLFRCYATEARWDKAIQHLREAGQLKGDNSDIKYLIQEIQKDTLEEELVNLKNEVWSLVQKDFTRELVRGFAEYYMKLPKSVPMTAEAE